MVSDYQPIATPDWTARYELRLLVLGSRRYARTKTSVSANRSDPEAVFRAIVQWSRTSCPSPLVLTSHDRDVSLEFPNFDHLLWCLGDPVHGEPRSLLCQPRMY